ncbi:MAG: T9SS type A sorting domain-containing protein, partial [Candidatus Marinimicrobia bacterium]|nr:T9SS type A sorting domain-containing protein [Candidatus Neomarinimicrobiota bacterium]
EPGEIEYSLDTNLPEDLLMTVRYRRQGHDGFYAFYDVTDGARERIPTYKTGFDTYEAYVSTGKTITFDESPVKAGDALPSTAQLWTHPNPFNATLQMSFMMRLPDRGQIKIYNLLGQEIFSTERMDYAPGIHSIAWHGRDQQGRQLASGIYFVQLTTDRGLSQLRKVTLLK